MRFDTRHVAAASETTAPDGSAVRVLCWLAGGGMAMFTLPSDTVARAVAHRTVEEIWYIVSGHGRMWRRLGHDQETVELAPGVSISIPASVHFQFRCDGAEPLRAVAVTMPPWPGANEAYPVTGIWTPTV